MLDSCAKTFGIPAAVFAVNKADDTQGDTATFTGVVGMKVDLSGLPLDECRVVRHQVAMDDPTAAPLTIAPGTEVCRNVIHMPDEPADGVPAPPVCATCHGERHLVRVIPGRAFPQSFPCPACGPML